MEIVKSAILDRFRYLIMEFLTMEHIEKNQEKLEHQRKPYQRPKLEKLGGLISDTLPGGSKGAEGNSGKGFGT